MIRTLQRATAVGLTVCLLFLSGLIYPQTVAHAAHHAHHKAATHATALCSWMCAAGQVLEGVSFGFLAHLDPVTLTVLAVLQVPPIPVILSSTSTGPLPQFIFVTP